jgi:hypothetical protein
MTRVFYEMFAEDRDVPVVVVGVATFVVLAAGIYGAGQGGIFHTIVGLAVGTPLGIGSGLAAYMSYWTLKVIYIWARKELYGD